MKAKLFFFVISTGLLLSLFPGSRLKSSVQASSVAAVAPTPISITEAGLDPQVVQVAVDSTVVWTNHTAAAIRLVGGEPNHVYLPFVKLSSGNMGSVRLAKPMSSLSAYQGNRWIDVEILPGQSTSFTFTTLGDYPYYFLGSQVHTGKVTVVAKPLFESVLYMPNDTGSSYVLDNTSLDVGVGTNDDFTIEAFFYVPDVSYGDTFVDAVARKDKSFSFYIHFHNDQADRIFFTLELLGIGEILLSYPTNIPIGWHHVAAVFDNEYTPSEDAFSIFLDGARVAHSPEENIHVDWSPGIPNSTRQLEIGGVGSGGFHGYLDEIRISEVARYSGLTYTVPTEPFAPDGSIRALWHFDEVAGSTLFMDSSSYNNHLTGFGGAQTYQP